MAAGFQITAIFSSALYTYLIYFFYKNGCVVSKKTHLLAKMLYFSELLTTLEIVIRHDAHNKNIIMLIMLHCLPTFLLTD